MEKYSKSNKNIINNSYSPQHFNFVKLFLRKVDDKIITKLYKLKQQEILKKENSNSQRNESLNYENKSTMTNTKNILKVFPSKSYIKSQKNIIPKIIINNFKNKNTKKIINLSHREKKINIHLTQIKQIQKNFKVYQSQKNSKLINSISNRSRNFQIPLKRIKKITETKNNSINNSKITILELNYTNRLPFSKISLTKIKHNSNNYLPNIKNYFKFFQNETLKNAMKQKE
jgi:hypothetical protein